MKHFILFLVACILSSSSWSCSSIKKGEKLSVIPKPLKMESKNGNFLLTPQTKIVVDAKNASQVGNYLVEKIQTATGYNIQVEFQKVSYLPTNAILLSNEKYKKSLGEEGYTLSVKKNNIKVRAMTPAGLFYGIQTLLQLLPPEIMSGKPIDNAEWVIPCVAIKDRPRFTWRGAHLDVCRHFFSKEFVKKYIDILAMHKINTFHWHLTEDQGWRSEIKKYPKLTEIGAWRVDRGDKHWNDREPQKPGEKATYGGFYTQDEIREIVEYAKSRFITVVPEIEMPGHAVAALASYPQYSCTGGPFTVIPGGYWPITNIYCAGNDETFEFLENVLDEVIALFPGKYVHIGGDEAHKANWEKCPKCQARIKNEGLKNEHELQSYFIKRIEKFLNSQGKTLIGWDEILEGGLAPNAVVMSWRGTEGGIAAANAGHDVIMSPTSHCYFDYYQAKSGEPLAIGGFLPLEKVYSFEPVPDEISKDKRKHIIGAQANVWTEYIPTPQHCEYMLLPRLSALAEVVWSDKDQRNFENFQQRMAALYDRFVIMNVNFRVPPPIGLAGRKVIFGDTKITLKNPFKDGEIRYTLDGSEPTIESMPYSGPILISGNTTVKVQSFMSNGKMSNVAGASFTVVDRNKNGLEYQYFEGNWKVLPSFNILTPIKTGLIYQLSLDEIKTSEDYYAVKFSGYIKISKSGEYTFYTNSDDGSKLFIKGEKVVDNDGSHGPVEKSGTIKLKAGMHLFEVEYFEDHGGERFDVFYKGPEIEKQIIPADLFFRNKE